MPEPTETKVQDAYDRNVDNPFESEEGHPNIVDKIKFQMTPVITSIIFGRALFAGLIGHSTLAQTHYWPMSGAANFLGNAPPVGAYHVAVWFNIFKMHGLHPKALNFRLWIIGCIGGNLIGTSMLICRQSWIHLMHIYTSGIEYDQPSEDTCGAGLHTILWGTVLIIWCPYEFIDKSAWGIYCCANMPQIRIGRITYLEILLMWVNFFYNRILYVMMTMPPPLPIIAAIGVFAWKRCLFLTEIAVNCHDTPFKGHVVVVCTYASLLQFNVFITIASVGVSEWADMATFIITDWMIYILRIVIVARIGMRTCPKLIAYLITKHLENMPGPLPNHCACHGDKTAMRTMQAYMALTENESLTSLFILQVVHFIFRWNILKDTQIVYILPMMNMWVVFVYCALDFIQDILADRISSRFSTWTFIYKASGWYHRRMLVFQILTGASMGFVFEVFIGIKTRALMHDILRSPIMTDYWWSSPASSHY